MRSAPSHFLQQSRTHCQVSPSTSTCVHFLQATVGHFVFPPASPQHSSMLHPRTPCLPGLIQTRRHSKPGHVSRFSKLPSSSTFSFCFLEISFRWLMKPAATCCRLTATNGKTIVIFNCSLSHDRKMWQLFRSLQLASNIWHIVTSLQHTPIFERHLFIILQNDPQDMTDQLINW